MCVLKHVVIQPQSLVSTSCYEDRRSRGFIKSRRTFAPPKLNLMSISSTNIRAAEGHSSMSSNLNKEQLLQTVEVKQTGKYVQLRSENLTHC